MNTSAWFVAQSVKLDCQVSLSLGCSGFSGCQQTVRRLSAFVVVVVVSLFESINPEILMDLR